MELQNAESSSLELENQRYKYILEGTNAGTWELNFQTGAIDIDEKWAEIIGYTREELSEMTIERWHDFVSEEDVNTATEQFAKMISNESDFYVVEYRMKHKNGQIVWVTDRGKVISRDEAGMPLVMFGTHLDITERKESEKQSHLLMEQMLNGLAVHEIICDEEGNPIDYRFLSVNKKFEEQTGLKGEEIVGKTVKEIMPNTEQYWIDLYGTVALTGEPYEYENYSGEIGKWFKVSAYSPSPKQFAVITSDITDVKTANDEIVKKTEELDRFFSINLDLLCIADLEGTFVRVNKAWETILGYPAAYLEGKKFLDFVHPEDIQKTLEAISLLSYQDTVRGFVNRYLCYDGTYKYIEWYSQPYGKFIYAAARDITAHIEMEDALYLEKEQFRTTLLSVGDAVISTDVKGNIVVMNHIAELLTGWSQEEAIGKPLKNIFKIIHEYSREPFKDIELEVLRTGQEIQLPDHYLLISRNGVEIPIEDSAAPIKDQNGKISGVVIVFRDFTEKREKQRQVEYLTFYDYLTGLYNRRYMDDVMRRLDTDRNLPFSILVLDVNGLKLANDAFGHDAGDDLLKKVAEIIQNSCRTDDIKCRTGGDEFAVLLPRTDEKQTREMKHRILSAAEEVKMGLAVVSVAVGYAVKSISEQNLQEIFVEADREMYKNKLRFGKLMRTQTVNKIMEELFSQPDHEKDHAEKVSHYSREIAIALGLDQEDVDRAKRAGLMHDIGKILMPAELRNKPGKLRGNEWEMMKRHPITGYQILKEVDEHASLADIVLYHHERYDGTGYPEGKKGDEIPVIARIIAIAEAYEEMTSERSLAVPVSQEKAVQTLKTHAGRQFDPDIVKVFIEKVLL